MHSAVFDRNLGKEFKSGERMWYVLYFKLLLCYFLFFLLQGNKEKDFHQFHYTAWPDHGVPDTVSPILELIQKARKLQPNEKTPIIVHCRYSLMHMSLLIEALRSLFFWYPVFSPIIKHLILTVYGTFFSCFLQNLFPRPKSIVYIDPKPGCKRRITFF